MIVVQCNEVISLILILSTSSSRSRSRTRRTGGGGLVVVVNSIETSNSMIYHLYEYSSYWFLSVYHLTDVFSNDSLVRVILSL